jgi:hypothetical protein
LRQDVINKVQVEKMGNVNPTHPQRSFIENQCSSLLLFNSCLWTQTRKKRVVYCKFYLQFTHSAYLTNEFVQKEKIQFCWMTKTLQIKLGLDFEKFNGILTFFIWKSFTESNSDFLTVSKNPKHAKSSRKAW